MAAEDQFKAVKVLRQKGLVLLLLRLWIFLLRRLWRPLCKKIPIKGLLGSLHGIKMHYCAFLFNFALKRNKLLGNFHSRAAAPARPSAEDIRLAFDPALSCVIVSLKEAEPELKSFLVRGGIAEEEPVRISPPPAPH